MITSFFYTQNISDRDMDDHKRTIGCVLHGRHYLHMDVKEVNNYYSFNMWIVICGCYMCLPCNLVTKSLKGVGFVTRRANQDFGEQQVNDIFC